MTVEDLVEENQSRPVKAELSRWKCRKTSLDLNLGLAKPVYSRLSLSLFLSSKFPSRSPSLTRWPLLQVIFRGPHTLHLPCFSPSFIFSGRKSAGGADAWVFLQTAALLSQWRKTSAARSVFSSKTKFSFPFPEETTRSLRLYIIRI